MKWYTEKSIYLSSNDTDILSIRNRKALSLFQYIICMKYPYHTKDSAWKFEFG